jgi:hypothetical protein
MKTELKEGDIYVYKRPDSKWGYFQLLRLEEEIGNPRKICFVQTFGDPTEDIFSGTAEELGKMSLWKRTSFRIFADKVIEIDPQYLKHVDVAEDQLKVEIQIVPPFDSVNFFWLDYLGN